MHAKILCSHHGTCSLQVLDPEADSRMESNHSTASSERDLDFSLLAKHHSDTCLGGWLGTSLQTAQAWDGEDAILLHLLCGDGNQAVDNLRAHLLLQAMLSSKSLGHGSLGHGLASSLHRLHWREHGACW